MGVSAPEEGLESTSDLRGAILASCPTWECLPNASVEDFDDMTRPKRWKLVGVDVERER